MTPDEKYVVVYQIGKVASTSLVTTLNQVPGVECVQSHFLGDCSLQEIIPTITGADVSEYFYEHQFGQFIANIEVTRKINLARAGKLGKRLVVISLARDPVEWIRSSIVQDMEGYLPTFLAYAEACDNASEDEGELVAKTMERILTDFTAIFEAEGGIDATLRQINEERTAFLERHSALSSPELFGLLMVVLRPFDWFENHFERALGVRVADMEDKHGLKLKSESEARYYILRYEDLPTAFFRCIEDAGIEGVSEIHMENISEAKPYAAEAKRVFSGKLGHYLRSLSSQSAYCKTFGYAVEPVSTDFRPDQCGL
jgi:hypothetical protein